MKTPIMTASLMLMLLLLGCGTAEHESPTPSAATSLATAEVHAAADARLKALAAGDVEAYLSVYTDDAVWMPPSPIEVVGKEAARLRIGQAFETATLDPVIHSREQTVMSPDWIADRGQYSIMVTPKQGGESRQEVGSFLILWRRDVDGKWKIYFDIWNTDRPIVEMEPVK